MNKNIEEALKTKWKIILYKNVLKDPLVIKYINLLEEMAKTIHSPEAVISLYYEYITSFIQTTMYTNKGMNNWPDYIMGLIAKDENPFSLQCERKEDNDISKILKTMAQKDLRQFQNFALLNGMSLTSILKDKLGKEIDDDDLALWQQFNNEKVECNENNDIGRIMRLKDWGEGVDYLRAYYRKNGVGIFGEYRAFRWVSSGEDGRLVGVKNYDNSGMDKLFEYKKEKEKLIENTRLFINGYRANNVLLYGDRGTGKSSTVKALVNLYGDKGLRLVEVFKRDLKDLPDIMNVLAGRAQKFLLFVDDLSFAEQEGEYRDLKALLEGGVEDRPQNVVVYATSNRKHLVYEKHSDREVNCFDPEQEDVRRMDTIQEKLSLADRFGITITFTAPDQEQYLRIVEQLARDRGLDIETSELRRLALQWELTYNIRSPRTARQFIDHLEGKLALTK